MAQDTRAIRRTPDQHNHPHWSESKRPCPGRHEHITLSPHQTARSLHMPRRPAPFEFVAYIRVSSKKQAYEGSSMEEQTDAVQAYANRRGAILHPIHEDVQSGGGDPLKRPGLRAAVDQAVAQEVPHSRAWTDPLAQVGAFSIFRLSAACFGRHFRLYYEGVESRRELAGHESVPRVSDLIEATDPRRLLLR